MPERRAYSMRPMPAAVAEDAADVVEACARYEMEPKRMGPQREVVCRRRGG